MNHAVKLRTTMNLSWEIQGSKRCNRSQALRATWAITQHEHITVRYLVKRHSHYRYQNRVKSGELTLFNQV